MKFRLAIAKPDATSPSRVDREKRIITGVSMLQIGEALGHDLMVDSVMLQQCVDAVNSAPNGIKSRFTHPGACNDAMGKQLGRVKDARVVGDKAVADLHLSNAASNAPGGDLAGYVMDLAEEDPTAFGLSIAFDGERVWKLADGGERQAVRGEPAPANATTKKPLARIAKMGAADAVDEPAANRDGLFAAAFSGTSNEIAAEAFAKLDAMRESLGFSITEAADFLTRYLSARGIIAPANTPKDKPMDPKKLVELCAAHKLHSEAIVAAFAAGKTEQEILAMIAEADAVALKAGHAKLTTDLEALKVKLAAEETKATELVAENAKLKAKLGKVQAMEETGKIDPGADPASGEQKAPPTDANLKAEWAAMSKAKKIEFCDSYEAFADWRTHPQVTSAAAADNKE